MTLIIGVSQAVHAAVMVPEVGQEQNQNQQPVLPVLQVASMPFDIVRAKEIVDEGNNHISALRRALIQYARFKWPAFENEHALVLGGLGVISGIVGLRTTCAAASSIASGIGVGLSTALSTAWSAGSGALSFTTVVARVAVPALFGVLGYGIAYTFTTQYSFALGQEVMSALIDQCFKDPLFNKTVTPDQIGNFVKTKWPLGDPARDGARATYNEIRLQLENVQSYYSHAFRSGDAAIRERSFESKRVADKMYNHIMAILGAF